MASAEEQLHLHPKHCVGSCILANIAIPHGRIYDQPDAAKRSLEYG